MYSPCYPKNPICDTAFTCYAIHQQTIDDIVEELARAADPNDEATQHEIFEMLNVDMDLLTDYEIAYIERKVSKRLS